MMRLYGAPSGLIVIIKTMAAVLQHGEAVVQELAGTALGVCQHDGDDAAHGDPVGQLSVQGRVGQVGGVGRR